MRWQARPHTATLGAKSRNAKLGNRAGMGLTTHLTRLPSAVLAAALVLGPLPARAVDDITFTVSGGDADLETTLKGASLLLASEEEERTNARDLVATSLAEYERLLNTLYAEGYYGGVINVRVDGVEAANLATYNLPATVRRIDVTVDPGRQFFFSNAIVTPIPRGAVPTDGYAAGEVARAEVIFGAGPCRQSRDLPPARADMDRTGACRALWRVAAGHAQLRARRAHPAHRGPAHRRGVFPGRA